MRTRHLIFLLFTSLLLGQADRGQDQDKEPVRMPNGTLQSDAILKVDHQASLKDAAQLQKLSLELTIELEKNDRHVLSMQALKKLDEMEKLVKRIRARMKRF